MRFRNKRKYQPWLLALAIGFSTCALVFALECFFPFGTGVANIGYWVPGITYLVMALFTFSLYSRLPKMEPNKAAKNFGIVSLVFLPLILVAFTFFALADPNTISSAGMTPLFVIHLIVLLAQLVLLVILIRVIVLAVQGGNHGLLAIFSHCLLTLIIHSAYIIASVFYIIRAFAIGPVSQSAPASDLMGLIVNLSVQVVIYLILLILCLLVSFMTLFAGIEKRLLSFGGSLKASLELSSKYDVPFWVGIFTNIVLLLIAIVSAINLGEWHFSLVILYVTILAIRLPSFFWRRHINKRFRSPAKRFVRYHGILLYASIMIFVFTVLSFLIGGASLDKMETSQSAFMTFVVFVPWALYRFVTGIVSRVYAKRTGDPNLFSKTYLDLLVAFITVSTTLFYVANFLRGGGPIDGNMSRVAAIFLALGILFAAWQIGYGVYASIRLLVVSIRGLKGKRVKAYEKYQVHLKTLEEKEEAKGK